MSAKKPGFKFYNPGPKEKKFRDRHGLIVSRPAKNGATLELDFKNYGLVCRLRRDGPIFRLAANIDRRVRQYSNRRGFNPLDGLLLDLALNLADRFHPPESDDLKPVKLRLGKASPTALALGLDFAETFLRYQNNRNWKPEPSLESGALIENLLFEVSLRRVKNWFTHAVFLLALRNL